MQDILEILLIVSILLAALCAMMGIAQILLKEERRKQMIIKEQVIKKYAVEEELRIATITFIDGKFDRCDFVLHATYTLEDWKFLNRLSEKIITLAESEARDKL